MTTVPPRQHRKGYLTDTKPFDTLEQEWNINIPNLIRNSITALVNTIRRRYQNNVYSQLQEANTTLKSLLRASKQGCSILKEARKYWQWGKTPRSYHTYMMDDMIHISPEEIMRNLANASGTSYHQNYKGKASRYSYAHYGQKRRRATQEEGNSNLYKPTVTPVGMQSKTHNT